MRAVFRVILGITGRESMDAKKKKKSDTQMLCGRLMLGLLLAYALMGVGCLMSAGCLTNTGVGATQGHIRAGFRTRDAIES